MDITAFDLAQRFVGVREVAGPLANPQILAMLQLDGDWPKDDAVPWCSGFVNYICWLLRLPRSKSLMARSWLAVGRAIDLHEARVGFDVVVLERDGSPLAGHVGFFAGHPKDDVPMVDHVEVLGGNQGDQVSVRGFEARRVIGVRRLLEVA